MQTPKEKIKQLALVDCNNFYVSCERVFRPDLINTPVVALSNNDGCVISRSNEAKALGIKMGQPWFEIKDFAQEHGVLALSSNYALYADMSNRVMNILHEFAPRQEVYSIDESFLDLTGIQQLRGLSYQIKKTVMQWTGIPVCVGIGPTKTLAKLANHIAKKHPRSKGVFNFNDLSESQKDSLLGKIEVSEVWGIGRRLSQRLAAYNVHTVQDLKCAHTATLRAQFGVVIEKTQRELREEACLDLTEIESAKKQIVCMSVPLPQPSNDTVHINRWSAHLVEKMFKAGYQYKKAGIMLSEISPSSHRQLDMWEPQEQVNTSLMRTVDAINTRYGRGTVCVSTQGASKRWQMKQERKSPNYTTDWDAAPLA